MGIFGRFLKRRREKRDRRRSREQGTLEDGYDQLSDDKSPTDAGSVLPDIEVGQAMQDGLKGTRLEKYTTGLTHLFYLLLLLLGVGMAFEGASYPMFLLFFQAFFTFAFPLLYAAVGDFVTAFQAATRDLGIAARESKLRLEALMADAKQAVDTAKAQVQDSRQQLEDAKKLCAAPVDPNDPEAAKKAEEAMLTAQQRSEETLKKSQEANEEVKKLTSQSGAVLVPLLQAVDASLFVDIIGSGWAGVMACLAAISTQLSGIVTLGVTCGIAIEHAVHPYMDALENLVQVPDELRDWVDMLVTAVFVGAGIVVAALMMRWMYILSSAANGVEMIMISLSYGISHVTTKYTATPRNLTKSYLYAPLSGGLVAYCVLCQSAQVGQGYPEGLMGAISLWMKMPDVMLTKAFG